MTGQDRIRAQDLRSFGRRRGRKLSARQADLVRGTLSRWAIDIAQPAPVPLGQLFFPPRQRIWLEIGFGGGEHLIQQATANRDVGLIGAEPFEGGVVKVLAAIEKQDLENIRLYADDARPLLRWLPAGSIERVFILFPDPWPKRRHTKRRLVSRSFLHDVARVLIPAGDLRFATDVGDYAAAILEVIQSCQRFQWDATCPDDWRQRSADWPQTRYERKALRDGRRSYYLNFRCV